jgi:hypothetical protein
MCIARRHVVCTALDEATLTGVTHTRRNAGDGHH